MISVCNSEIALFLFQKRKYLYLILIIGTILTKIKIDSILYSIIMQESNLKFGLFNFVINSVKLFTNTILPLILIYLTLDIISDDYSKGTMKFKLISPIKRESFIIGKIIFLLIFTLVILIFYTLLSFIIGCIFFKTYPYIQNGVIVSFSTFLKELLSVIIFNYISMSSFICVISFLSFIFKSKKISFFLVNVFYIGSILLNGSSNILYKFSLIRYLNLYNIYLNENIYSLIFGVMICIFYAIISLYFCILLAKKREIIN